MADSVDKVLHLRAGEGVAGSDRGDGTVTAARPVTAFDLAVEAGRTVPRAWPWSWLLAARVPLVGEGASGRCQRCGRALPLFSDPIAFGPMGRLPVVLFDRSPRESALLCLVCGPRSRGSRPFTAEAILDATGAFAAIVGARHWRHWHRMLRRELSTDDEIARMEHGGQGLELFRRFGPGRWERRRGGRTDPLETLVVSSARYWPPQASV
jgi:hypothetical protein